MFLEMMMRRRQKQESELLQLTIGVSGAPIVDVYNGFDHEVQFSLQSPTPEYIPTGTIQIFVNDEEVVAYDIDGTEYKAYSWRVGPEVGVYSLKAVYSGDSVYAPAISETVTVRIIRASVGLSVKDVWTMEGEAIPSLVTRWVGVGITPPTGTLTIRTDESGETISDTFDFTYTQPDVTYGQAEISIPETSPLYSVLNSLHGTTGGSYTNSYTIEYSGDTHYTDVQSTGSVAVYEKSGEYEIGYFGNGDFWCIRLLPFEDHDGVEHYPTGTATISLEGTPLSKTYPVNADGVIFYITEAETDVFTAEELATLSNGTYNYHITYSGDEFFKPYDGRGGVDGGMLTGKTEVINRTHTLTIHYVDYDDNTVRVFDDYVTTLAEGQAYNRQSPTSENYYTPDPYRVEGTMDTEDIVETVTYKRRTCNVLIQYKFTSGGEAAPSYTATVPMGEDFDVESPTVNGYSADTPTVTVDTSKSIFNRTVYYTPIVTPIIKDWDLTVEQSPAFDGSQTDPIVAGKEYIVSATFTNIGISDLSNVQLNCDLSGDYYTFDSVAPDESKTVDLSYWATGSEGTITFIVNVTADTIDPDNPTITDSATYTFGTE